MGLARLGRAVAFIGRVGADGLGQMVRNGLRGEGVDVEWLRDDADAPTGALARDRRSLPPAEVVYLRRGSAASRLERRRTSRPPARRSRERAGSTSRASRRRSRRAAALRCSARCSSLAPPAPASRSTSTCAGACGASRKPRRCSPELAEHCDLIVAGEDEAVLLCGSAEAAALAERFGVEAVVKLGARGAVGWRNGEWADDAGIAVAPLDVVGAGDAFTAGYLDALLDGAGLAESLRRANACGAIAVAAVGDATGLPTRGELERVLAGGADVVPALASATAVKVAIVGGGVVGLCSAYALRRAGAEVVLLERERARPRRLRGQHRLDLADDLDAAGRARRTQERPALGVRPARRARHPPGARHGLAALAVGVQGGERASALPARRQGAARPQRPHVHRARCLQGGRRRVRDARRRHPLPGAHGVRHRLVRAGLRGSPGARLRGPDRDAHARRGARDRAVARRRRALRRAHERRPLRAPRVADGRARREAARPAASSCASTSRSRACAATAPAGRSTRTAARSRPRRSSSTAGAATPPLLRPFGLRVPIVAAKGYSLTLQGEGVAPRTALYLCEPKIGVSGYDGGVRIAGTFELPGRNLDVDRKRVGYILDDTLPVHPRLEARPGRGREAGLGRIPPRDARQPAAARPDPGPGRPLRRRRPRDAGRHARARHGRGGRRHGDDGHRPGLAVADGAGPQLLDQLERDAAVDDDASGRSRSPPRRSRGRDTRPRCPRARRCGRAGRAGRTRRRLRGRAS